MKQNNLCDFRFFSFRKCVPKNSCDFEIAFFANFFLCEKDIFVFLKNHAAKNFRLKILKNPHYVFQGRPKKINPLIFENSPKIKTQKRQSFD